MRILFSIISAALLSAASAAQTTETPQPLPVREISGQVRLAGRPAPPGVPVSLRIAFNRELLEADQEESARATTDAGGKFTFGHVESLGKNGGKELFSVSAIYQGFRAEQQLVDLTENLRGEAVLDLDRLSNNAAAPRAAPAILYSGPTTGAASGPGGTAASGPRRPRNREALEAMDRGQDLLFRKKDPEAGLSEFKKALKLDPWYGPGYIMMGLANMQLQRWDEAQYSFQEATKVEPGNAEAYLGLGSALNEQHNYAAAQKALEQSLGLNPDSAEAHYELARTLFSQGKWQAAQPHAQKAVAINPNYAGPHALMGNIYLQAEDADGALAEFRTYLRLEPGGSLAPQVKDLVAQLEKAMAEDTGK